VSTTVCNRDNDDERFSVFGDDEGVVVGGLIDQL
jgi:hypothetical protein